MSYDVGIIDQAPVTVASVRIHTDLAHIGEDIGRGFSALMAAIAGQAVTASGPPLTVYLDVIDEHTEGDIEVCVPVAGTLSSDAEVSTRELAGGSMAATLHQGPYDQIGPAYQAVIDWITEQGHAVAGPPREVYLNDPQAVPPEDLLTRVEFPIFAAAH